MPTREERLALIVQAKDQTGRVLSTVNSDLGRLISLATGPAGAAVALTYLGRAAFSAYMELGALGAQAQRSANTFGSLVGGVDAATFALAGLRRVTKDGVDDQTLMTASSKFMSMQLAKTVQEAERLAYVSTQLGMAMNMPGGPTKAMEYFALLLANKSIRRLDEFGISATRVRQRLREMGSSIASDIDFMNVVMAEAAITMERVGEQSVTAWESQEVAVKNLRVEIGLYLSEVTAIPDTLRQVTVALTEDLRATRQRQTMLQAWRAEVKELGGVDLPFLTQAMNDHLVAFREGRITYAELLLAMQALQPTVAVTKAIMEEFDDSLERMTSRTQGTTVAFEDQSVQAEKNRVLLFNYTLGISDTAGQIALLTERLKAENLTLEEKYDILLKLKGLQETEKARIDQIGDAMFRYQLALAGTMQQELALWLQRLDTIEDPVELYGALTTIANLRQSIYDEQLADAKSFYSDMRSIVESALTATTVTEEDLLRARLGIYEEKWDEMARRAEDVANLGLESPWAALFEIPEHVLAGGPERIKLWGKEMAAEIRTGLRPEMIDWIAFDQEYARILQEREARKRLVEEGMRRVGGTRADVARALGVPVAPETQAATLAAGYAQIDMGGILIKTLATQIEAKQGELVLIGQTIASQIIVGFRDLSPVTATKWAGALGPALFDWLEGEGAFGGRP